jgi:hypothetical protein
MIHQIIAVAIFIGFLSNAQAMEQSSTSKLSKLIGNHVYEYLFQICLDGNLLSIKRCVEGTGADLNIADKNDRTALHYLCANNHLSEEALAEAVHYLVTKGASLSVRDIYGKQPTFYLGKDLMNRETVNPFFDKNVFFQVFTELIRSAKQN